MFAATSECEVCMEFAVNLESQLCVDLVKSALENVSKYRISKIEISLARQSVLLCTTASSRDIKNILEGTGKNVVLVGLGPSLVNSVPGSSAVTIISSPGQGSVSETAVSLQQPNIKGIIRIIQLKQDVCLVDGFIDGLVAAMSYNLSIHENGDLSGNNFENLGQLYCPSLDSNRVFCHTVMSDNFGNLNVRFSDDLIEVIKVIGRSFSLTASTEQTKVPDIHGPILAAGIIARSSGIFENSKKICACDGVTIWEEKNRPLVGHDRRIKTSIPNL